MTNQLQNMAGIGPKTIDKLAKLGIFTTKDLLFHFPRDYIDFSHFTTIGIAPLEENISLKVKVLNFNNIHSRRGKNIQIAKVADKSDQLTLFWLNQSYLSKTITPGKIINIAGQISIYKGQKTMFFPRISIDKTNKIIPIYPETKGITSAWFTKIISKNFESLSFFIQDPLPAKIKKTNHLPDLVDSLFKIHQPQTISDITTAKSRLSVDELLAIHLNSILQKQHWQNLKSHHQLTLSQSFTNKIKRLIKSLPFKLTHDQKQVWQEISTDLTSTKITNRLLQGDVGSGKTIIALLSAYLTHLNHKLSVIIAPTQILANQHYQTFKKLLSKVPIVLVTADNKKNISKITNNSIVISTHSIFYHHQHIKDKVSLLIIDEQHKFGVDQRGKLLTQKYPPHTITMTATPIPRSIELTLLGNLDISTIKQMPKARLKIKSYSIPLTKQLDCYHWLAKQIKTNHSQAFVVCPFITESDKLNQVVSAQLEYKKLTNLLPSLSIGLLHGGLKSADRQTIVTDFIQNKYHILVTTPIIEVGVDIKNANYMIINSADRFGLSQLHQLRGRIGRGSKQAYCFFFSSSLSQKTQDRLKFISKTNDCFKIAKYDLESRGPGTIFSTLQHGFPQLKLANLSNITLNQKVRLIAKDILKNHPKSVDKILSTNQFTPITQN